MEEIQFDPGFQDLFNRTPIERVKLFKDDFLFHSEKYSEFYD